MYSFGIKDIKRGVIDKVTGLGTNMTSVGAVYKDTCDFTRADAQVSHHYSQQQPNAPKVSFNKKGIANLKFSLMNTDAETKKTFLGGTVTTLTTVKTHNELVDDEAPIHYAYEIETTDGRIIKIYKGHTVGKENFQFRDSGIILLDISITPLAPNVAGLPVTSSTDAPVVV